ncbi:MAG: hypothetical protein KDA60_00380 [Planctomycetales bacterium]|nr:hypothetical protein [Planctomycetales bacterium]
MALSSINWRVATSELDDARDLAPWSDVLSDESIAAFADQIAASLVEIEEQFRDFSTTHTVIQDRHASTSQPSSQPLDQPSADEFRR